MIATVLLSLMTAQPQDVRAALMAEADRLNKPVAVVIDDPSVLSQPAVDFDHALKILRASRVESDSGLAVLTAAARNYPADAIPEPQRGEYIKGQLMLRMIKALGNERAAEMLRTREAIPITEFPTHVREEMKAIFGNLPQIEGQPNTDNNTKVSMFVWPKLSFYPTPERYYGVFLTPGAGAAQMKHPHPNPQPRWIPQAALAQIRSDAQVPFSRDPQPLDAFVAKLGDAAGLKGAHLHAGMPKNHQIWLYSPREDFTAKDALWLATGATGLGWRTEGDRICLGMTSATERLISPSAQLVSYLHSQNLLPGELEPTSFLDGTFQIKELTAEGRAALLRTALAGQAEAASKDVATLMQDDRVYELSSANLWIQASIDLITPAGSSGHAFPIR